MAQEHTIAFGPFRLETPPGRFGVGGGHAGIGRGVGAGRAARGRVDGPGRGRDAGGRDRGAVVGGGGIRLQGALLSDARTQM